MEGPCFEQSEPLLQREPMYGPMGTHHQPARAMKFLQQKPVKGLVSAQEWTHYHPEIKFQSTADGGKKNMEEKKDPAVYMGCIKKRKKSRGGGGFPLGQDCLELRLSVLATKMRWRGTCTVLRWTFVLKKCEAGHCTEG